MKLSFVGNKLIYINMQRAVTVFSRQWANMHCLYFAQAVCSNISIRAKVVYKPWHLMAGATYSVFGDSCT